MVTNSVLVAALGAPLLLAPPSMGASVKHRESSHPARVNWAADGAVTGFAVGAYILLRSVLPKSGPRTPPAQGPSVLPLDSVALGRFSPRASKASDVVLSTTVIVPVAFHLIEASIATSRYGGRRRGAWFLQRSGTDLLLYTEAMAINAVLTTGIKRMLPRARPFTHLTLADVDEGLAEELIHEQAQSGVNASFLSGHTSWAFTAATVGATLLTLKLRERRTPWARAAIGVTWVLSLGAATSVATLRVLAGRHYPTDVLAGAALGSVIGVSVPLLHVRRGPRAVRVGPHGGPGVTGLRLQGSF